MAVLIVSINRDDDVSHSKFSLLVKDPRNAVILGTVMGYNDYVCPRRAVITPDLYQSLRRVIEIYDRAVPSCSVNCICHDGRCIMHICANGSGIVDEI